MIPLWDLLSSRWKWTRQDNKETLSVWPPTPGDSTAELSIPSGKLVGLRSGGSTHSRRLPAEAFPRKPQTAAKWVNKSAWGRGRGRMLCPEGRQFAKSFIMSQTYRLSHVGEPSVILKSLFSLPPSPPTLTFLLQLHKICLHGILRG